MPTEDIEILNFNRGLISKYGLARHDVDRIEFSATEYLNFFPKTLGSISPRGGLIYTGSGTYNNKKAYHVPFIYSRDDVGVFEFTDNLVTYKVDDEHVLRDNVATTIANSTFDSDILYWIDNSDTGGASAWETGGYLALNGNGYSGGSVYQEISVSASDAGVKHGLQIKVSRGSVSLMVGTSVNGEEYVTDTLLTEGVYSLAFTPNEGSVYITLSSRTKYKSLVDFVTIETSGVVALPTDIPEEALKYIRNDQVEEIIYIACKGVAPFKMVRYGKTSFGIVPLNVEDGFFRLINTDETIQLTPSGLSGDIAVASNAPLFKSGHVGALFKIASAGQEATSTLTGGGQWSNDIRVSGITSNRAFDLVISGTWSGKITLQKSTDEKATWSDYKEYTANTTVTINDGVDNHIIYYRLGFDVGDYISGTADVSLDYSNGSVSGVFKVTEFTDNKNVSAVVLSELGGTNSTSNWYESWWSEYRGYPSGVALHEERLVFGGIGHSFASVSNAYESFDTSIEGNSSAFVKALPSTGSFDINGIVSLDRLFFATDLKESFLRSSSYSEPLSKGNSTFKMPTSFGTDSVAPVVLDDAALAVQRSGERLLLVDYSIDKDNYATEDVSKLVPEFMESGVVRIVVQRMPDTRTYCIMGDGTVMVYLYDSLEDVKSWVKMDTSGFVEDAFFLPSEGEDLIYFCVKREISGSEVRYIEMLAKDRDTRGEDVCYLSDSCILYNGASTDIISGLEHLEGEDVVVWGDSKDVCLNSVTKEQEYLTVSSGKITLPYAVSVAVVGLPYECKWKGTRLQNSAVKGAVLLHRKRIRSIGFEAVDTHALSIKYGSDFDNMDFLPFTYDFENVDDNYLYEEYHTNLNSFDGLWKNDTALCLKVVTPRPCNILAVVMEVETNERSANR